MKEQTLFYHGKSGNGNRFTVAGNYKDTDLVLAIAICSKEDQFVKRTGRNKSEGRLKADSFKGCTILSLFDKQYFKPTGAHGGFVSDWFEGKETDTFVDLCQFYFDYMSTKELMQKFNLNG